MGACRCVFSFLQNAHGKYTDCFGGVLVYDAGRLQGRYRLLCLNWLWVGGEGIAHVRKRHRHRRLHFQSKSNSTDLCVGVRTWAHEQPRTEDMLSMLASHKVFTPLVMGGGLHGSGLMRRKQRISYPLPQRGSRRFRRGAGNVASLKRQHPTFIRWQQLSFKALVCWMSRPASRRPHKKKVSNQLTGRVDPTLILTGA